MMRSWPTTGEIETIQLPDMSGRKAPASSNRIAWPTCSIRSALPTRAPSPCTTIRSICRTLTRDDGEHLDLAAVDIFRDRERGVPRYNQFRRLLHKEPVKSFEELTDNPVWREEIRRCTTTIWRRSI